MTDLIKRDDALRIVEEYDVLHDHIKALPAIDPAAIREAALQTRIEELVEERDTARRLLAAATQMQTETQVKLAKAVEMLILCGDMFDEVAHPSDPLSVMIKTTLVELGGK